MSAQERAEVISMQVILEETLRQYDEFDRDLASLRQRLSAERMALRAKIGALRFAKDPRRLMAQAEYDAELAAGVVFEDSTDYFRRELAALQ